MCVLNWSENKVGVGISSGKCAKEDKTMDMWNIPRGWEFLGRWRDAGRDELMNEWIGDWYSGNYYCWGPHEKTRGDRTGRINMQCFGVVLCVPGNIYCHHCKYYYVEGSSAGALWSGEEAPHLWWNNGGQAGAWQEWMLPLSTEWLPPGQADKQAVHINQMGQ